MYFDYVILSFELFYVIFELNHLNYSLMICFVFFDSFVHFILFQICSIFKIDIYLIINLFTSEFNNDTLFIS